MRLVQSAKKIACKPDQIITAEDGQKINKKIWVNTNTQSICFEYMGRFVTRKKNQVKKKAGCKKSGSLLFQKRRGQAAYSLFE
jgi:hypothetical protein